MNWQIRDPEKCNHLACSAKIEIEALHAQLTRLAQDYRKTLVTFCKDPEKCAALMAAEKSVLNIRKEPSHG